MIAPPREGVGMYGQGIRERAVAAVLSGASASGAARSLGVGRDTLGSWCREAGVPLRRGRNGGPMAGVDAKAGPPGARTSPRSRLTYADRVLIEDRLRSGASARGVARELGFSHTTVSREVARHLDGSCVPSSFSEPPTSSFSEPRRHGICATFSPCCMSA